MTYEEADAALQHMTMPQICRTIRRFERARLAYSDVREAFVEAVEHEVIAIQANSPPVMAGGEKAP